MRYILMIGLVCFVFTSFAQDSNSMEYIIETTYENSARTKFFDVFDTIFVSLEVKSDNFDEKDYNLVICEADELEILELIKPDDCEIASFAGILTPIYFKANTISFVLKGASCSDFYQEIIKSKLLTFLYHNVPLRDSDQLIPFVKIIVNHLTDENFLFTNIQNK